METKSIKTIFIDNPQHLKVNTENRTRKKSSGDGSGGDIRIRQPRIRERNQTPKRNSLLKFIRRHQEKNRQKLFAEDGFGSSSSHLEDDIETSNNVDDTIDYLMHIANKAKHSSDSNSLVTNENVSIEFPSNPYNTYSDFIGSSTQQPQQTSHWTSHIDPPSNPEPEVDIDQEEEEQTDPHTVEYENEETGEKIKLKYQKQKKTKHRTYKLGKSKHLRKIGVLVSNKTIRKGITTKTQLLKQTPIHEIRQYLIKHGLIKVGTTAPNEVLRKMYETAHLICGELNNHNTDILLHNFVHNQ